jgi:putative ABC transport system permease protein
VKTVPGVTQVSPVRFASLLVRGVDGTQAATGVEPETIGSVLTLKWKQGSAKTLSSLADDQLLLDGDFAKSHDFKVGGTVHVTTPANKQLDYKVAGLFKNQAGLTANIIATAQTMAQSWDSKNIAFVMAAAAPGTNQEQLATKADRALKSFPAADALSIDQFKDKQEQGLNSLVGLVFALLLLSVLIALLGIVNTLALSVHERTRELGMLRAVGMSRRQVRRMVRAESVITAIIGAVLGTLLGLAFALIVSRPLADQGFVFIVPIASLVIFFILAGVAGVLAAIPPARRAAKVDVLRAVTTE